MPSKKVLLASVSLLAVGMALGAPHEADAATCATAHIVGGTISAAGTQCVNWTGGNLSNTGSFTPSGPAGFSTAVRAAGTLGTLTNSGTIQGSGAVIGVGIASTATVNTIGNSGLITGATGISNVGSIGAVTNRGSISGTAIGIHNGTANTGSIVGTITSLANSGHISGPTAVYNQGRIDTISNSGSIAGTAKGIYNGTANSGSIVGTITSLINSGQISGNTAVYNQGRIDTISISNTGTIHGTIHGAVNGIYNGTANSGSIIGTIARLTNSGQISGGNGVYNVGRIDTISNTSTGTITVSGVGVYNGTANAGSIIGTVTALSNTGTINAATGVYNHGKMGTLINNGSINGTNKGIFVAGSTGTVGTLGTLTALSNTGTISGDTAVYSTGNIGTLTNDKNAVITGTAIGIANTKVGGTIGTLTALANAGTITGGTTGVLNNGSIGTLSNTGSIGNGTVAGNAGINNGGTITTFDNRGTITGTKFGVANSGLISDLNNAKLIKGTDTAGIFNSGTITALSNSGTITSNLYGVENSGTIDTLTNNRTISGATGIYSSAGSIGALVNNGRISGTTYGINVGGGTITKLSNSGTIIGKTGIAVAGTISTISNTGLITGTAKAITITGAVGTISNSGVIAGMIDNTGVSPVTIVGGSGGVFGTLTGTNGGIGSATGDLVFKSGNSELNDNVIGNVTVDSGASLKIANSLTVSKAFTQTGGTLSVLNGSTLTANTANIQSAQINVAGVGPGTHAIVIGGASSSYTTNNTITSTVNILGYSGSLATAHAGETLEVKVGAPLYSGNTQTMADLVNQVSGNGTMAPMVNKLLSLPNAQWGDALHQLQPAQTSGGAALSVGATRMVGQVGDVLLQRSQTSMAWGGNGLSAGSTPRTSAMWAQAIGGVASRDSTGSTDGYDLSTVGLVVGGDTRLNRNLLVGGALSWGHATLNGQANAAGTSNTVDSYQLTGYGAWAHGRWLVNGQAGVGYNKYSESRNLDLLDQSVTADYSGQQYTVAGDVEYAVLVGRATLTPTAGLRWLRLDTGKYDEKGGSAALSVGSQTANQLESQLGAKLSYPIKLDHSRLVPEVKGAWVHDFINGDVTSTASLAGVSFQTTSALPDANGVAAGVGLTYEMTDRVSLRAEYNGQFRQDYRANDGMVEVKARF